MIKLKSPKQIEIMKRGGIILSKVMSDLMRACVPGAQTEKLDQLARKMMEQAGGKPSFLNYKIHSFDPPYPSAVCISINDEVVHGPATPNRIIKDGDLVSLDAGLWYEGLATDIAVTVCVGNVPETAKQLSAETRKALELALEVVRPGSWIHDIGKTIQDYLEPKGYGIIRDLVGHGVGFGVHEEPQIPHYHDRRLRPVKLKEGMCLAIEPMVSAGNWQIKQKNDGWTIITADGSLAAHWEVTLAVTKQGYELITPWPSI